MSTIDHWDGHSWTEAERAAEKMVFRSPTFAVALAGALRPSRFAGRPSRNFLSVTEDVVINVPVDRVYDEVSDVTQMGRWSPENLGATVRDAVENLAVGTIFDGHNRRGRLSWTTRCEVIAADRNERFAFKVKAIGRGPVLIPMRIATWSYEFRSIDQATTAVTETWTVGPWPPLVIDAIAHWTPDGIDGAEIQRRNVIITLQNLKASLEASETTTSRLT